MLRQWPWEVRPDVSSAESVKPHPIIPSGWPGPAKHARIPCRTGSHVVAQKEDGTLTTRPLRVFRQFNQRGCTVVSVKES